MLQKIHLENLRIRYKAALAEYFKIYESVQVRQLSGEDMFGSLLLSDAKKKMESAQDEYFNFMEECLIQDAMEGSNYQMQLVFDGTSTKLSYALNSSNPYF